MQAKHLCKHTRLWFGLALGLVFGGGSLWWGWRPTQAAPMAVRAAANVGRDQLRQPVGSVVEAMRPSAVAPALAAPAMLKNADVIPCAGASFSAATTYPVGEVPESMAQGDFNLDGRLDLVATNRQSDSVTVYLGQGDGTFGSRADFTVGHSPEGIAVGDFNSDGKPDLVTANRNDGKVSVLYGAGNGSFGGRRDFQVGHIPIAVAVGDFNGDGKLDLAVANANADFVTISLGDGMGGFGTAQFYPTGGSSFCIIVGDFNNDGKQDVATANRSTHNLSVFLGNGDGTLAPRVDYAGGRGTVDFTAVGDFNKDGKPDLVTVSSNYQEVFTLPGDGSGRFDTVNIMHVDIEPVSVAVGDFDLDGNLDIAVEGYFSVLIMRGDGQGHFGPPTSFPANLISIRIVAGDYNGDGKLDLAAVNFTSNNLLVLLNNCTPNTPPMITAVGVTRTAGSPVTNATIAHVNDTQEPADALAVTINGGAAATSNGVSVSNLAISPSGDVTADVGTACGATTATFTLRVTDGGGLFAEAALTITVNPNTPPVLSYGATTVAAGTTPTINPAAGPSDNGTFGAITLTSVTPNTGLMLGVHPTTGVVSITNASLAGNYNVVVSVTDTCGATTNAQFTIYVTCPTITLSPATLPGGSVNTAYNQTISAAPSGTNYGFALGGGALPDGLTLSSGGSLTGMPTQSGTFNFRVTATGFGACAGFRDYQLTIACATITVSPTSLAAGTVGASYSQTVSATPANGYSFAVTGGALPAGLTLNAATGVISGTPSATGSFGFRISASLGGCVGSRDYTLQVNCATLTFTDSLPPGTAGNGYAQTIGVTPGGSYTFSLVQGNLPGGLTLNATTGLLGGMPQVTGTYNFTIRAQAANGCGGTQSYALAINCPTVTLTPASLPNGATGAAYSQSLSAQPAGGGYSYTVTSGALPAGLALNPATGVLSGTPTAGGTFNFTITAAGFGSCTGSKAYSITIGTGACPTITLADLPGGAPGQMYSNSVTATPSGAYGYVVTVGSLPPGLTLYGSMGLLYGYPTTAGTYGFTITATDSNNCTGSKQYNMVIGGAAFRSAVFGDFDGDGKADLSVWRGEPGDWLIVNSGDGKSRAAQWGAGGAPYNDVMVTGDYDGDGKADVAVWRVSEGKWYVKCSRDESVIAKAYGQMGDVPVAGRMKP